VAMQVIPGVAGFVRAKHKPYDALAKGSYMLSAILSNSGFVGAFTVFILFGEVGYGWANLVMLLAPPVVYGMCFPMAQYFYSSHHAGARRKESIFSFVFNRNQVPMIGVIAGFGLSLAGVERPAVLGDVFRAVVHVLAWMILVPVGSAIDFKEMRGYWRDVFDLLPIKFVITPLLTWLLGWSVGLDGPVLATAVILAASPVAINAIIVAKLQNLNVHLAIAAFVLTTVVYLFVVFPLTLMVVAWLGLT
jgi:hypothetical protein